MPSKCKGLLERLGDGEDVLVAEGYLFEFERRGYLKAGAFVPEVVIEHPDLVRVMHEEFVHAGSDVVEAFTYYGHREKLRLIGREDELEKLNRKALRIARQVADDTGTLMAGNICNTTVYNQEEASRNDVRAIFKEQVEWAAEEKADFIIAETFGHLGEAMLALDAIKEYGGGIPAVITMSPTVLDKTHDGYTYGDAMRRLEEHGAAVVGLNCHRGPETILPVIKEVRAACKGPIACLPVPYRTHAKQPGMVNLTDAVTGENSFPLQLDPWLCSRDQVAAFAKQMKELGVQYMGLCCGNRAFYMRSLAEALGRSPPASHYAADMSQHMSNLTDPRHKHDADSFCVGLKGE